MIYNYCLLSWILLPTLPSNNEIIKKNNNPCDLMFNKKQ